MPGRHRVAHCRDAHPGMLLHTHATVTSSVEEWNPVGLATPVSPARAQKPAPLQPGLVSSQDPAAPGALCGLGWEVGLPVGWLGWEVGLPVRWAGRDVGLPVGCDDREGEAPGCGTALQ